MQLPISMKTVLSRFNATLSDQRTIYAACPSCSSIYPPTRESEKAPYPKHCTRQSSSTAPPCNTPLLRKGNPIRPFILPDLFHYISKLLSDKEIERHIDRACEDGVSAASKPAAEFVSDPFQATYLRSFKGPDGHRLFIDGGPDKEARLIFSLNVDWFNVFRSTNRGANTSTGVIILACLNLPPELRYRPEYMFVAIIPGPKTPMEDQINHFLEPLVNSLYDTWYKGIRLSSTANYPNGRVARSAIGPVVCDLPAARKVAGLAAHNTIQKFCSVCNHTGKEAHGVSDHPALDPALDPCGICSLDPPAPTSEYRDLAWHEEDSDLETAAVASSSLNQEDNGPELQDHSLSPELERKGWLKRSVRYLRKQAFTWKNAKSKQQREKLWAQFGVRWSVLWRLPYWNPIKQLVIDSMHALLEGAIQYHFREILRLSEEYTTKPEQTFKLELDVDDLKADALTRMDSKADLEKVKAHARLIIKRLTASVDNGASARAYIVKAIASYNKPSLYHIASELHLIRDEYKRTNRKKLAEVLVEWVSFPSNKRLTLSNSSQRLHSQPLRPEKFVPDNVAILQKVRSVIQDTDVPSWLPYVPKDWGSAAMGTPTADEWRTMATVYFPIALIHSWQGEAADAEGRSRRQLLDLTMCVVQATWLACRQRMSKVRRAAYLKCMCTYLHNLQTTVENATFRPNQHMSIHLYEFLDLWGPVYSWWCFPFERINGSLQRIATNKRYGE